MYIGFQCNKINEFVQEVWLFTKYSVTFGMWVFVHAIVTAAKYNFLSFIIFLSAG